MRKEHLVLRTLVAAALVVMVATGCSTVGPESAWDGNSGAVTGTVSDRSGSPIGAMSILMWAEVGSDGREVTYEVTSRSDGTFDVAGIDLGDPHSFAQTYDVYVNRMKSADTSLNENYVSHYCTVSVQKDVDCVVTIVLDPSDVDPGVPGSMFE